MTESEYPIVQGWQITRQAGDDVEAFSVERGEFVPMDIGTLFRTREIARMQADEFGIEIGDVNFISRYEF